VDAQDASLAGAHLEDSVLGEGFSDQPSVALTADGGLLAMATARGEVWLWSVADRKALLALQAHNGTVWSVAISADGRIVASGGGTTRCDCGTPALGVRWLPCTATRVACGGWLCPPTVGWWRVATVKGLSGCGHQRRRAESLVNLPWGRRSRMRRPCPRARGAN
jgi:hypothetical protein